MGEKEETASCLTLKRSNLMITLIVTVIISLLFTLLLLIVMKDYVLEVRTKETLIFFCPTSEFPNSKALTDFTSNHQTLDELGKLKIVTNNLLCENYSQSEYSSGVPFVLFGCFFCRHISSILSKSFGQRKRILERTP